MSSLMAKYNGFVGIRLRFIREVLLYKKGLRLGRAILNSLDWFEDDDYSKMLLVSMVRATHRMEALYILSVRGYGKDSILILRAIFEDLIELKYLALDKGRTADVIAYDDYLRLKMGGHIVRSGYQGYDAVEFEKRTKELADRWAQNEHKFKYPKGGTFRHWSGLTLDKMATAVGLEKAYESLYPYASQFMHSTSLSANDFVLGRDLKRETVVMELGSSNVYVEESLITALMMFVDLLNLADEHQKLKMDERIREFSDEVMRVGKIPKEAPKGH